MNFLTTHRGVSANATALLPVFDRCYRAKIQRISKLYRNFVALFEDENGNILQWWTADEIKAEVGDQVLLTGTVKAHDEYKGVKSATVTRCKIKAV